MTTNSEELNALRKRCEHALAVYEAASRAIEVRLRANQNPTAAEWRAEENARAMLSAARRTLARAIARAAEASAAPPPPVEPSPGEVT